jgi:hypothetical protein
LKGDRDKALKSLAKVADKIGSAGWHNMLIKDPIFEYLRDDPEFKAIVKRMQDEKVGYLAVSLGYFKTLFSSPGHSTSSEIPKEEQEKMGLSEGLVRISIGLDNNIHKTFERIKKCLVDVGLLKN